MRIVLAGAFACLLWTEFAASALGSNQEGVPTEIWVAEQVGKHKIVDFNEKCGGPLDPITGDEVRWGDPCRTIAANDLRKIILGDQLPSEGVRLVGVHVNGTLDLSDVEVKQPLVIRLSRLDGAIDLTQGRLLDPLELDHTRLGPFIAAGLHAERRLTMTSSLFRGKVNLHNARVDGNLAMNGSTVEDSIDGHGLEVLRHLLMIRGTFKGAIELSDAKIGGNLDMEASIFEKKVNGLRLKVADSLFMNNRAKFHGNIILDYAEIGGNLEMEGQSEFARIEAESLKISHHLFMGGKSSFHDFVSMPFLHVTGYVDLRLGLFTRLDLSGSIIGQELRLSSEGNPAPDVQWLPIDEISPALTLSNAEAATMADTLSAWPSRVDLDGFTFSRLRGSDDRTVEQWENWLKKSTYGEKRFNSQPFSHLGKILTEAGHRDQGLALQFAAREGERWQAARNGDWSHWLGLSALRWLSGYGIGMYTFIAIPWVLGSVAIGVLALRRSRAARANGVWWCIGASLERLLPIIELNKEFSDFFFDPNRERLRSWQLAFFAVYSLWGWVLGLVLISAMSGLTQGS